MKLGRRLWSSLLTITVVTSLICLGSYAYFHDIENSGDNALSAATLDLKIKDPNTGHWVDDPHVPGIDVGCSELLNNMEPGDKSTITIPIWNAGSIEGKASFCFDNLINYGGDLSEPEYFEDPANGGGLGRLIWVYLKFDNGSGPVLVSQGWLEDLNGIDLFAPELLMADAQSNWIVDMQYANYNWPDNQTQGDYLTFDVKFGLKEN